MQAAAANDEEGNGVRVIAWKKVLGGRCYIGAHNCSHTAIRVSRQAERRPGSVVL